MKKVLLFVFAFMLAFQVACFAASTVTNLAGTIKVTASDGTVTVYNTGDTVPAIVDGSTIEVVSGTATVTTQDGNVLDMNELDAAVLTILEGVPTTEVLVGEVTQTSPDGTVTILKPKKKAEGYTPPADDPTGVDTELGIEESARDISPTL